MKLEEQNYNISLKITDDAIKVVGFSEINETIVFDIQTANGREVFSRAQCIKYNKDCSATYGLAVVSCSEPVCSLQLRNAEVVDGTGNRTLCLVSGSTIYDGKAMNYIPANSEIITLIGDKLGSNTKIYEFYANGSVFRRLQDKLMTTVREDLVDLPLQMPTASQLFLGCPQPFCFNNGMDVIYMNKTAQRLIIGRGHHEWFIPVTAPPVGMPEYLLARSRDMSLNVLAHINAIWRDKEATLTFYSTGGNISVSFQNIPKEDEHLINALLNQIRALKGRKIFYHHQESENLYVINNMGQYIQFNFTDMIKSNHTNMTKTKYDNDILRNITAVLSGLNGISYFFFENVYVEIQDKDFDINMDFRSKTKITLGDESSGFFNVKDKCKYSSLDLEDLIRYNEYVYNMEMTPRSTSTTMIAIITFTVAFIVILVLSSVLICYVLHEDNDTFLEVSTTTSTKGSTTKADKKEITKDSSAT
ncbi:hypothetical protein HDE_09599 [Halotydeus destructor]|nr:hypothetical protein HDE_09599 [Halotydeus destructor]